MGMHRTSRLIVGVIALALAAPAWGQEPVANSRPSRTRSLWSANRSAVARFRMSPTEHVDEDNITIYETFLQAFRVVDDEEELLYEYDCGPGALDAPSWCVLSDDGQRLVSLPASSDEPDALLVVYGPEGEVGSIMLADLAGAAPGQLQQFIDTWAEEMPVGQTFVWAEELAVFTVHHERPLLGVWLIEAGPWRNRWVCLDTDDVFAVDPDEALRAQLDASASERAQGIIAEANGNLMDAVRYLGVQRQREDRPILEAVLVSAECDHSQSVSIMNGVVEFIRARSYSGVRLEVDRVLSQWNGLDDASAQFEYLHCNFLGLIEVPVELPGPMGSLASAVCVYLVPESVTPAEWAPATSQRAVDFFIHPAWPKGAADSTRLDFVLGTVPPGRYWVQAVWDRELDRSRRQGAPVAGDFVGQSAVFEVIAGQSVNLLPLACETQVTEEMAAEWARQQQDQQQEAEDDDDAP